MMPIPALAALGVSVGSKLLGGLFGGKSKKKQEEAQRQATIGGAENANAMHEDQRTARAAIGSSLLGQAGSDFALDPALAARLQQTRSYDFGKGVPQAGAGMGSGLLSGLFGGIGDVASQYGINAEGGGVPTQEVPTTPDLRSRVGEFDTGIDYRLKPNNDKYFGG
jgi:hypothetical protein